MKGDGEVTVSYPFAFKSDDTDAGPAPISP